MAKLPYKNSGVELLKTSGAALVVKNIDPHGFTKGVLLVPMGYKICIRYVYQTI
jgi:hypothetical protein